MKKQNHHEAEFRLMGELATKGLLFDRFFYPKFILRPICWFRGHKNHVFYPFGFKAKQCKRCAKVAYKKKTKEKLPKLTGEIGELHGVRFVTSTFSNLTSKPLTVNDVNKAINSLPKLTKRLVKIELCKKHWDQLKVNLYRTEAENVGLGLSGVKIVVKPYLKKIRYYYRKGGE